MQPPQHDLLSLRQTGLRAAGQVMRGAAAFVSTPATIPSKFETTLHRDVREPKGFGSSSFRFDAQLTVRSVGCFDDDDNDDESCSSRNSFVDVG
jgi:hypothetical protein